MQHSLIIAKQSLCFHCTVRFKDHPSPKKHTFNLNSAHILTSLRCDLPRSALYGSFYNLQFSIWFHLVRNQMPVSLSSTAHDIVQNIIKVLCRYNGRLDRRRI